MAKETKKSPSPSKYKAVDVKQFKVNYNSNVPCYEGLSSGESVVLDEKNKHVINWINNKIIVKE